MRLTRFRKRYAMAVDTLRCVGCSACVIACKEENGLPLANFRSWVVTETTGTFPNLAMEIRSERCEQCSDAACVTNCPTGASYVATGGVVLVDHDLCTGCKACVAACPYDARSIHPDGYADKCTFCLHRVDKGLRACLRHRLSDAVAHLRRSQRSRQQHREAASDAAVEAAPHRSGNETEFVFPRVAQASSLRLV